MRGTFPECLILMPILSPPPPPSTLNSLGKSGVRCAFIKPLPNVFTAVFFCQRPLIVDSPEKWEGGTICHCYCIPTKVRSLDFHIHFLQQFHQLVYILPSFLHSQLPDWDDAIGDVMTPLFHLFLVDIRIWHQLRSTLNDAVSNTGQDILGINKNFRATEAGENRNLTLRIQIHKPIRFASCPIKRHLDHFMRTASHFKSDPYLLR
mmetsp:Transcript_62822/g.185520  ORF Transcript_62822/g.185520 Transcript_62822/m.185520 type:complete len:206 (-) Transcript_62822:721-1338(-)